MAIYKDGKKWRVVYRITEWDGSIKQSTKRGFKTKKEALAFEATVTLTKKADLSMKLKDFVDLYFEDKQHELKATSIANKRKMISRHVIPYLGERKLNEITASDLIRWQGEIVDQDYSPSYQRMLNNQINALFNHAERVYCLKENPVKRIKRIGSSDNAEMQFWTYEEYKEFLKVVPIDSKYWIMFEILFWTGLRESELLALRPMDLDITNKLLHVRLGYHRINGQDIMDVPKTDKSIRTINIPEFLATEISDYLSGFYELPDDVRIFPIVARTLQKTLKTYAEMAGVKQIRVHDLRHSHAAYLINHGVDMIVIRDRLGHKDIKVTINTYGHLYPSKQVKIAEMIDQNRKEES